MNKKRLCKLCSTGWILCLIGGISIPIIDYVIKKMVRQNVIIKEGGVLYDLWKNIPIPIYMQFYMFNVTNTAEILKGGKPYVKQVGPYTYMEKRQKYNITFNSNGTVSYRQNRVFTFVREMSVGNDSDVFLTPNALYWTVLAALKNEYVDINKLIKIALQLEQEGPFYYKSVRELVWGYEDPSLKIAHKIAPEWFYTDYVGYFMNKNNTDDGVYTVDTGAEDINNLGIIDKYNGSSYLNYWTTSYANMVNGTDGTLGPPYLSRDRELYLFSSDICRSVTGIWTSTVKVKDISLRRYTASKMYVENATLYPDNIGYCTPQSSCMDTGLINISTCQTIDYFHIPAVVSLPHFYMASDRVKDSVGGLSPNAEEHQTHIDLEHNTGLVLFAAKRLQINIYIQPVEGFDKTTNIKKVSLPVFWINETAMVNDKYANQLKSMLFTPKLVVWVVQLIMIIGGSLLLLVSVFYGIYATWKNKQIFLKGGNQLSSPIEGDERQPLVTT